MKTRILAFASFSSLMAVLTCPSLAVLAQTNGTAIWWGEINGGGNSNQLRVIAAGSGHDLAIKSDGTVVAWGSSAGGATSVPGDLNGVIAIAGGGGHSLAARTNGQLVAWGANSDGQAAVPAGLSNVVGVAAGNVHSVALKSDGTVAAWGYNGQGQCTVPAGLSNVIAIGARGYHTLALKSNGTVVAWADNAGGQTTVPANLSGVVAIAAGGEHSVALCSNGTIVAWGNNTYGQCTAPTNLGPFIAIGAGWYHTLGLKADHTVVAWGAGLTNLHNFPHYGQSIVPPGLHDVVAVAGGTLHSLVLVVEPPRIEVLPASQTVAAGSPVDFLVLAAGAPPLRYQWLFDGTNVLSGATNWTVHLTNAQPADSGAYRVVVTNLYGAVTSSPAILTVATVPVIVAGPTNLTVAIDDPADFYVTAVGDSQLVYQWYFRGTGAISGATSTSLHLDQVQLAHAGEYSVVVTNGSGAATSAPALLTVKRREGVVINCTEAALRAAMVFGGSVTFACNGTIFLTNTITNHLDTTFDGAGHDVVISGVDAVRVFFVPSNSSLTLKNLKVYNGRSVKGAGIFNDGGTLTLSGVTMGGNYAFNYVEPFSRLETAEGGAIYNQTGVVNASACLFNSNRAFQGSDEFDFTNLKARGGAIRNVGGIVNLQDCQFTGNYAAGAGTAGPIYYSRGAAGGAVHNSGTLTVTRCSFLGNAARGEPATINMYPAFAGGAGSGGAIYNDGSLALAASTVASNTASGGSGGSGAAGCATCPGSPRYPGSPGSNGGSANGGGLCNAGIASAVNCTFAWNTAVGGAGGPGGPGGPGMLHGISGTDGGNGGGGGSSFGGAIDGAVALTNCTLAFNSVVAGVGGAGGLGGSGVPPGISGQPGATGNTGSAGGGGVTEGTLAGSLLATNVPGGNSSGVVSDGGHNLSSDSSCNFAGVGSLNNTNPRLAPLGNYGGPTLTLALLPGSPAIDGGDQSLGPAVDQRGRPRPYGRSSDVGAYEVMPLVQFQHGATGGWDILLRDGQANQTYWLMASPTLFDWQSIATNQTGPEGSAWFQDIQTREPRRFYRVAKP